ncbi:MAG TPA: hypothetical protein VF173_34205 [Thermoanaerobaculia bacterium]|nr:hypothetical protein [Thermoanaerobaculia bacterium]
MSKPPRDLPPKNAIDRFIRRFHGLAHLVAVLLLYAIAALGLGLALAPALWLGDRARALAAPLTGWSHWLALGLGGGVCFFVFGFALLAVVVVLNWLLPTRFAAFRGSYYTLAAVPWFVHNALFYLVRFTILPFFTFTPIGFWFLRAMGMKIGRGTLVNSEYFSDLRFLTLGENVAVGGSVRIFAHYGGGGRLTIAPVEIGDRVTLGLGCTVMGDVVIGDGATILPHSVLLPGSRVGEGEVWGGVPARLIPREEMERFKEGIHGVRSRTE